MKMVWSMDSITSQVWMTCHWPEPASSKQCLLMTFPDFKDFTKCTLGSEAQKTLKSFNRPFSKAKNGQKPPELHKTRNSFGNHEAGSVGAPLPAALSDDPWNGSSTSGDGPNLEAGGRRTAELEGLPRPGLGGKS